MRRIALALIACAFASSAAGDATNPWSGTWRAIYDNRHGIRDEAEVVILGAAGTWLIYSNVPSKYVPCRDQRLPVIVKEASAGQLSFTVDGASLIDGCPVFSVTLARIDDNTLEGTLGNTRSLRLTRK